MPGGTASAKASPEILSHGVTAADAVGVGITGQWGSTVPVGKDGDPVGPCMLWSDTRGRSLAARRLGGPINIVGYSPANLVTWLRLTGGAPSPGGADPLGHHLHLAARQPEVYARVETLFEPLDYLGMRFTGRRAATQASMILSWLTDNRPRGKGDYQSALLNRSGREAAKLPELLPTGSVLGGVQTAVGAELGLPEGIPVVAGIPDLHTGYIGSGAVAPYAGHVTISTSAWIGCEVPFKRTDVFHQVASVPGLRKGSYLVANNHETAGLCLQWLRDSIGASEDGTSGSGGYERLTALASTAPAGAGGVMFTPWLNGERSPVDDRTLRAAFLNISMTTERAHLVRAVLEGVAFNARWLLELGGAVHQTTDANAAYSRWRSGVRSLVSDPCRHPRSANRTRCSANVRKPPWRRTLRVDVAGKHRPGRRRGARCGRRHLRSGSTGPQGLRAHVQRISPPVPSPPRRI